MQNNKKASAKAGQKLNHAHSLALSIRRQVAECLTRFTSGEQNGGSLKVLGRNQTASSTQPSGFLFCPRRFVADCQRRQSVNRQRGLRVSVRTRPLPSTRRDNPHQFPGGSLNLEILGGHHHG